MNKFYLNAPFNTPNARGPNAFVDVKKLPLGKGPSTHPVTRMFRAYLPGIIPSAPATFNVDTALGLSTWLELYTMGNLTNPDCVIAEQAHQLCRFEYFQQNKKLLWAGDTQATADCLARFSAIGGGPNGLNIAVALAALEVGWTIQSQPLGIADFAAINKNKPDELEAAIAYLMGFSLGLELPLSAQSQTGPGEVWDVSHTSWCGKNKRGGWGGHNTYVLVYNHAKAQATCITWGAPQIMTYDFIAYYSDDEVFGLVDRRDPFLVNSPVDTDKWDAELKQICAG